MLFSKNKSKTRHENIENQSEIEENHSTSGLRSQMMKTLLKKKAQEDAKKLSSENDAPKQVVDNEKISGLIKQINSSKEKIIAPRIDLSNGRITYPILAKINEDENNVGFLENLTLSSSEVLEKVSYEKLVVCPRHSDSLLVNVRFYCPKCNSMDIEKLHLLEHSRCGYISEKTNFEHSKDNKIISCPSCGKSISDFKKELRIPGMWYSCKHCSEKFDDVLIKMHCRKYEHDFDSNQSQLVDIPGFKIKDDDRTESSIDVSSISDELTQLLQKYEYKVEKDFSLKGKSGHYHHIDLYGKNKDGKTIFLFIKKSDNAIDNSEINSKIIQVLDTSPDISILIGFASISEKAKSIASSYNVSIVTSQDLSQIITSTDHILAKNLPKSGENEDNS